MASLQVAEKSRAEREGRAGRAGRVIPLDEYGNPEEGAGQCPVATLLSQLQHQAGHLGKGLVMPCRSLRLVAC